VDLIQRYHPTLFCLLAYDLLKKKEDKSIKLGLPFFHPLYFSFLSLLVFLLLFLFPLLLPRIWFYFLLGLLFLLLNQGLTLADKLGLDCKVELQGRDVRLLNEETHQVPQTGRVLQILPTTWKSAAITCKGKRNVVILQDQLYRHTASLDVYPCE
jgi:hypothetical protein